MKLLILLLAAFSYGGLCNIALNETVTTSIPGNGDPTEVVDGDTSTGWNAGTSPASSGKSIWIRVDFKKSYSIDSVAIKIDHYPNGHYIGEIYLDGFGRQRGYHVWSENLTTKQFWLSKKFDQPVGNVQDIRFINSSSGSWTAVYEIEIYSSDCDPVKVELPARPALRKKGKARIYSVTGRRMTGSLPNGVYIAVYPDRVRKIAIVR